MSKTIIKAWGLILTVMLLVSMFVPASPAAAVYGQEQWLAQNLPTVNNLVLQNGTDVSGLAAGPGVLYSINSQSANGLVNKSTDGGQSWSATTAIGAVTLTKIAVAPDNANVIAVTDGANFYASSDAGSTWSNLTTTAIPAGTAITGIAVAPARSGTLLGREYAMSLANTTAGSTLGGDVQMIGSTASWTSILPAGWAVAPNNRDWMAVAVTPNFVGDRSVIAVGVGTVASGNSTVITGVFNSANTGSAPVIANMIPSGSAASTSTDFGGVAPAVSSLVAASIAIPADYDATTSSGRRAFVSIAAATAQADNDVYRIDDSSSKNLGAVTAAKLFTVAYSGTINTGTLFVGRMDSADVKYSTDMTSGSPTWTATKKLLPATTTNTVVMTAPDFATSKKVYTATTGANSAFSVSMDGGVSFNQESLIDLGAADVGTIKTGPSILSNGKSMLVLSLIGTTASLWKSDAPSTDTSWVRLWVGTVTNTTLDKVSDNVYLVYDLVAGGNIYRTADAGATWNTRFAPTTGYLVEADTFQDENIGWVIDTNGSLYKTTNGAWTWTGPVSVPLGGSAVGQLTTGRTDEVIVGGNGTFSISKDGGATFTQYTGDSGVLYRIAKDSGYATNNILWMLDKNPGRSAFKFVVGTDAKPVDLLAAGTAGVVPTTNSITSPQLKSGALFIFYGDVAVRALNAYDTPGTIDWKAMPAYPFAVNGAASTTDVNPILYLRKSSGSPSLFAMEDMMAKAKPVVTAPSQNFSLSVNPVTGVGDLFTMVINPVGTGNALADRFDVQVAEQSAGWAAATKAYGIAVTTPTQPQIVSSSIAGVTFSANRIYQIRVRAGHQIGSPAAPAIGSSGLDSPWSDALIIKVASGGIVQQSQYGPVLVGPQGGASNVSTTPGFAWAPQFGANKYRVVVATDAALTKTVGGTPVDVTIPSFQPTSPLIEGTTYFWSVQVVDPSLGPVSVGTFTTAPKAAPAGTGGTGGVPTFTIPPITIPPISIPPQPTPTITVQAPPAVVQTTTPAFIWAVIIIGAILVIAVIVLIIRTRRVP